jgi:hypothetical protein
MDDEDSGYFKQYFDESEDITLMKKIYDVDVGIFQPGIDIIELPFSDINKSNLH